MLALLTTVLATSPIKPEFWLEKAGAAGFWVVVAIIFAESGLFFGFFLPGDSLLFLTGFLCTPAAKDFADANGLSQVVSHLPPIWVIIPVLFAAAFLGDQVGYVFGRKVGPALFNKPDSRFFKQAHVTRAHTFLEKHGPKTIFLARFVPIVRTFAPIVAGVGRMHYKVFVAWNAFGALCWTAGLTLLGYWLGHIGFFRDNIDYTIIAVILISLIPVFIEVIKHRREAKAGGGDVDVDAPTQA